MALLWPEFLRKSRPSVDWQEAGFILCIDPGETTGWALFLNGDLIEAGQWNTGREPSEMADALHALAAVHYLDHLVYEEYRIRGNRAQQHIGSEVVTIQHIGVIRAVAAELDVPVTKQTAGMAKNFATDSKLRRWGLYRTNQRHANDAIRHGVYWLLFHYGRKQPRART